jgi:hypothetical protein
MSLPYTDKLTGFHVKSLRCIDCGKIKLDISFIK